MRWALSGALVVALTAGLGQSAWAESFPAKPLHLLVPSQAGGPPDIAGRLVATGLASALAQQVVVENRGGGGGILAAEAVANAPADGYTLLLGTTASIAIAPALYRTLAYQPLSAFTVIGMVSTGPFVVAVNAALPVQSLQDLIRLGREQPGRLYFGSSGNATPLQILGETFNRITGTGLVHIPYKGPPAAVMALLTGEVQVMFELYPSFPAQVAAGKVRILAVMSPRRSPRLPEVPTTAEAGVSGFEASGWTAVLAPAATPPEVSARLQQALGLTLADPAFQAALARQGLDAFAITPAQSAAFVAAELARWADAVRMSGARVD
jgi:tripartite-type tricarboxylate transporter receptor subunit TctC